MEENNAGARQEYSRELKMAAMREIDSGKGMAEVARMYQLSPKRLETWRSEWRAKGDLAFPGKGAQPQSKLNADRISELERKSGQQTMEIEFFQKSVAAFQKTSSASRRQWRHRLYEQIQEAGEARAIVNRLCQASGNRSGGVNAPTQTEGKSDEERSGPTGAKKVSRIQLHRRTGTEAAHRPQGHRSL